MKFGLVVFIGYTLTPHHTADFDVFQKITRK